MTAAETDLLRALIMGVRRAVPPGKNERSVTTFITLPMWRLWCRAADLPEDCEPTEWLGWEATRRVYGSRTVIIAGDGLLAYSRSSSNQNVAGKARK